METLMAEKSRAEELHDEYRRKVWDDTKSGAENFDKYMLTFSGGALALSLGFIKDVVKPEQAVSLDWLLASWICFLLCILSTLVSFRVTIRALERMVPHLNEFYLKGNAGAYNRHLDDYWTRAVDWCANLATALLIIGLMCTMVFVHRNLRKVNQMKDNKPAEKIVTGDLQKGLKPVSMTYTTDGLKPSGLAPVVASEDRGIKPVAMTPETQKPVQSASGGDAAVQPAESDKK
jgi:hypothetical protein